MRIGRVGGRGLLGLGLAAAVACAVAAVAPAAYAATKQFHGVNWADPNDNFVTGPLQPVGLST